MTRQQDALQCSTWSLPAGMPVLLETPQEFDMWQGCCPVRLFLWRTKDLLQCLPIQHRDLTNDAGILGFLNEVVALLEGLADLHWNALLPALLLWLIHGPVATAAAREHPFEARALAGSVASHRAQKAWMPALQHLVSPKAMQRHQLQGHVQAVLEAAGRPAPCLLRVI